MNERHQCALGASPRLLVDEPDAAYTELFERGLNVVHAQRDVVKPWSALLRVARDHGIAARGLEQLEGGLACRDEMRPHALVRHLLRHLDAQPQPIAIERERLVEVFHRDTNVVEDGLHDVFAGSAASDAVRRGTRPDISSSTAEYGSSSRAATRSAIRSISP